MQNTQNIQYIYNFMTPIISISQYSTSHAGSVRWVHGSHRFGHSGRPTHAALVNSTDTENVGTALHQAGDRETGKLDGRVVALNPVGGPNLTPVAIITVVI